MSSSFTPAADVTADVVPDTTDAACNGPSRHSVRTAALLLAVASGVNAATWGVEAFWELKPSVFALVETGLQILLAFSLLHFRRRAAIPTLAFIAVLALWPLIRAAFVRAAAGLNVPASYPSFIEYGVILLIVLVHVLPFVLLLLGKQSRTKRAVALATFVFYELLVIFNGAMVVYLMERGLLD